jgi:polysaccharide deacetylase 2 family uncharacterized protein YibQ
MAGPYGLIRPILAGLLLVCATGWAESTEVTDGYAAHTTAIPRIALIIDDLGNTGAEGRRTVALEGPVACAILPHTPFARMIASEAYAAGKEVLLHLPLQPMASVQPINIGSIQIDNTRAQLTKILNADLASVPHVVGVNSHMGSLLTQHPGHMNWLMGEIKSRGNLFFVDSYTTSSSVALQFARENAVPSTRRDIFLDNVAEWSAIEKEFDSLKRLARMHGSAVGIGHPHGETLDYLEFILPRLQEQGFELVPVAALIPVPASDGRLLR